MGGTADTEYQEAMKRALARKAFLTSDGKYLTREEIHDRDRARAEEAAIRSSSDSEAESDSAAISEL
jgi:hypothetical protein